MLKIERAVEIGADAKTVWALFATQEGLHRWMVPNIEIDLYPGGRHSHVGGEDQQRITGKVIEMVPRKRLSLSWFENGPDAGWFNPIRMSFELEEMQVGTHVTFVIDGFEGIGTPTYLRTYEAYVRGTDRHHILENLKEAIAQDA